MGMKLDLFIRRIQTLTMLEMVLRRIFRPKR